MKMLGAILAGLAVLIALIWVFGPREPVDGPVAFDAADIGEDIDAYLYQRERNVPGLKRGAQKHVLWHDPVSKARTPLSVVYIHGFSASLHEIRPVPDAVAAALGANLYFTRLTGHGQDGAALARASAADWRGDVAEALEIGRRIGEKVIVIATSAGGSLATLAALDPEDGRDLAGIVFVSPNFRLKHGSAWTLTAPFARQVVPMLVGAERGFAPANADHGQWWTPRYPTTALMPMAALAKAAREAEVEAATVPALFLFSDADRVVDAAETRAVAARWGGPVSLWPVEPELGDDPEAHVIAGDILSPGLTEAAIAQILEWAKARGLEE